MIGRQQQWELLFNGLLQSTERNDGTRESLWRFLRKIMANTWDNPTFVEALEVERVAVDRRWLPQNSIVATLQDDAGHSDVGLSRQPPFDVIQRRISWNATKTVAVGVDDDFHEVRILESLGALTED